MTDTSDTTAEDTETGVAQAETEKMGAPSKVDTVEEPCPNCGVVQQMDVMEQLYDGAPTAYYVDRHCPVCGNHIEDPW